MLTEVRPFREDFACLCRYYPTIMDGPVFRWEYGRGEISASRAAVVIDNISFRDVERFRGIVDLAASVHRQLAENDRRDSLWFGDEKLHESDWSRRREETTNAD